MINPEKQYIESKMLKEGQLTINEQKVHDILQKDPVQRERRVRSNSMIDMDEFSSKYDQRYINKDKEWLDKQREKNDNMYKTQRAEIFEYLFEDITDGASWFGDDSYVIPALEFDDRKHHSDFVVEWENEGEDKTVKLAVDCTVSEDMEILSKKVKYIIDDLDRENMTEIKYFESDNTGEKEYLNLVPRAILCLQKEKLKELCNIFIESKEKSGVRYHEAFVGYYMQLVFLKEIEAQLEQQLEYVKDKDPVNKIKFGYMKKNLENTLDQIKKKRKEKESSLEQSSVQRAERDFEEIISLIQY